MRGKTEKAIDKTFAELCGIISKHKTPTPPWQLERLKFLNRHRNSERETVTEYVMVLKELARTCNFSVHECDNAIRDRPMHGIKDDRMQLKMIKMGDNMTLETALAAAVESEATSKSVKEMKEANRGALSGNVVHQV